MQGLAKRGNPPRTLRVLDRRGHYLCPPSAKESPEVPGLGSVHITDAVLAFAGEHWRFYNDFHAAFRGVCGNDLAAVYIAGSAQPS